MWSLTLRGTWRICSTNNIKWVNSIITEKKNTWKITKKKHVDILGMLWNAFHIKSERASMIFVTKWTSCRMQWQGKDSTNYFLSWRRFNVNKKLSKKWKSINKKCSSANNFPSFLFQLNFEMRLTFFVAAVDWVKCTHYILISFVNLYYSRWIEITMEDDFFKL